MQVPLDITAQNLDLPKSAEALIRRSVAKLDKLHDGLVGCRVVVEGPGKHHRNGGPYQVRVHMTVPGRELAVDRKKADDLTAAIRSAFEAARRQLAEHARVLKGDVKAVPPEVPGRVSKLFLEEGYGFVETLEGREIYFHGNILAAGEFQLLEVGVPVHFAIEEGDEGPQVSRLRPRAA